MQHALQPHEPPTQPDSGVVHRSSSLVLLVGLIVVLAAVAAGIGLFWTDGTGPVSVVTIRNEAVDLYGRGIYRDDTLFKAGAFRGSDAVTLFLGLPLLIASAARSKAGSLRGGFVLLGTLGWFLYAYVSLAFGAAYNPLFLLYVVLFSLSLFAFLIVFTSLHRLSLAKHFSHDLPRRSVAGFMFASGVVTMVVWLGPLLDAASRGQPPALLDTYTTSVTDVLDLGVIAPAVFLSGALILGRNVLGYLIAFSLLVLEALLAPMMVAQTYFQIEAGVPVTVAEFLPPLAGFGILALLAVWMLIRLLRHTRGAANDDAADPVATKQR